VLEQVFTSVVITTYEDDDRLEMTLRGFARQHSSTEPFEVVVINDGGDDLPTRVRVQNVVDEMNIGGKDSTNALRRIQYDYLGPQSADFRLAAARNLGIKRAQGRQLIICDCDTLPRFSMVVEHQSAFEQAAVLVGVRYHIRPQAVEAIVSPSEATAEWCSKHQHAEDDRLHLPGLKEKYFGIRNYPQPWEVCWGCNFSVAREPVMNLGGFDEEFVGWGGEDEDIARRLLLHGLFFKPVPQSVVFHLDHPKRTVASASHIFYEKARHGISIHRNGGKLEQLDAVPVELTS